jgi:Lamin Tail Domain/Calcineurin-like phosphoesterase
VSCLPLSYNNRIAPTGTYTPPLGRFMRSLSRVWLLIVCCLCAAAPPLRADVIISEIMYNPDGTDLDTSVSPPIMREWIELYNTGTSDVDLAGWRIGDSQDGQWASVFPADTIIQPQQAMVVTGDLATFDNQWGSGIYRVHVNSFPTLANSPSITNETVALRDPMGVLRDTVNFDQANGWPRVTGTQSQSIFALPAGLSANANNVGTNWAPAMWGAYGTAFSDVDGINHASPGFVDTVPQQPFMPSPDAAWSMAIIPDSQNYAKSSADKHIFTQQTEWIRDHREAFNIQVVLHEGDIVNNNNTNDPSSGNQTSTQQWQNAQESMFVLNNHLPYIMAAGNHDYGTTNAQNRSTNINNYFKATDNPFVDPAQGGILKGVMTPGEIQNAYYDFTAPDGREMLVIALEWEPRPATVSWANQIAALPEFADHTAVLLTHAYLQGGNSRYTSSKVAADYSGSELWQGLVKEHENFEMTFNGHFGGDGAGYLVSAGDEGNLVHQMFFNTQFETHGGDGWLRIVEFLEDGTTVRVRTYSPFWDMQRTHSQFSFEFQISPLPPPPLVAGDYNGNGIVDAADYVVWRKATATGDLAADGNGDNFISGRDYDFWKARFGNTHLDSDSGLATVPEPAGGLLLLFAAGIIAVGRRAT